MRSLDPPRPRRDKGATPKGRSGAPRLGLDRRLPRYTDVVDWLLLGVPGALVFVSALLALSSLLEQRVLSPRSMIVSAARARRAQPEFAEAFVAREVERLLREVQRR